MPFLFINGGIPSRPPFPAPKTSAEQNSEAGRDGLSLPPGFVENRGSRILGWWRAEPGADFWSPSPPPFRVANRRGGAARFAIFIESGGGALDYQGNGIDRRCVRPRMLLPSGFFWACSDPVQLLRDRC